MDGSGYVRGSVHAVIPHRLEKTVLSVRATVLTGEESLICPSVLSGPHAGMK